MSIMTSWVFFSVIAAFSFATSNVADKFIVNKHAHQPMVVAIISGVSSLLFGLLIVLLSGGLQLGVKEIFLLLFLGFLNQLAATLYFFALAREEVSRIVPIFYVSPIITVFSALIFFGEKLDFYSYFSITLLTTGAIMLSIDFSKKFYLKPTILLMLFSTLVYSISIIIEDQYANDIAFWPIIGWLFLGMGITAVSPVLFSKYKISHLTKKELIKIITWTGVGEFFTILGYIFMLAAFIDGAASSVNALLSLQALFVLIMTIGVGVINHKHLAEVITKKNLLLKSVSIFLLLLGTVIFSLQGRI